MEVVGRVVDGPQDHEQVAHGPAGVDQRAGLGPKGDAGLLEGVFQERERGPGRHQDGDVAEPGRPPGAVLVADVPPLAHDAGHGRRHLGRLGGAQLVGRRALGVFVASRGSPPRGRCREPARVASSARYSGCESMSAGRASSIGSPMSVEKVSLTQLDDRLDGPEVGGELDDATALGPEAPAGPQERGDVGPAEAVDRLLGVAHDEEVPGRHVDLLPRLAPRRLARAGRRRRCARPARSGWGRCPGTRRAAAGRSARAGSRARPGRARGHAAGLGPGRADRGTPAGRPVAVLGAGQGEGPDGAAESTGARVGDLGADGLEGLARPRPRRLAGRPGRSPTRPSSRGSRP